MSHLFARCPACGLVQAHCLAYGLQHLFGPTDRIVCAACGAGQLEPVATNRGLLREMVETMPRARLVLLPGQPERIEAELRRRGARPDDYVPAGIVPTRLGDLVLMVREKPITVEMVFADREIEDTQAAILAELIWVTQAMRGLSSVARWMPGETGSAFLVRLFAGLPGMLDQDVEQLMPVKLFLAEESGEREVWLDIYKREGVGGWRLNPSKPPATAAD